MNIHGGDLNVADNGQIRSTTRKDGNGGNIAIQVGGSLNVGAKGYIRSDSVAGTGRAGNIDIQASQVRMARGDVEALATITSDSTGSGSAGSINVRASKSIELAEGSFITSDTYGGGNAGSVTVSAPDILIGGTGLLDGAAISSDTYASGHAGRVEVNAQNVIIAGGKSQYPTGIVSQSLEGSSGDAGTVVINASGALQVLGGGVVASGVAGSGRGGEVLVKAGSIEVNGEGSQMGAAAKAT